MALPLLLPNNHRHPRFCYVSARLIPKPTSHIHIFFLPNHLNRSTLLRLSALPDDVPHLFEEDIPGLFENFPRFDNVPGLFENFPRFDNVPGLFENFPRFDNVPGLFENFPRFDNVAGLFQNFPHFDNVPGLFQNFPHFDNVPGLFENSPQLDDVPGLIDNSPRLDDVPNLLENSPRLDDVPGLLENSPRLDDVPGLFENSPRLDDVPGLFDNSPRLDDVPNLLENSPSLDDVPGLLENSPRLDDVPGLLENSPRLDNVPGLLENSPRLDEALLNFPFLKSSIVPLLQASESFSESQRWGLVVFMGLLWVYLTARPGVLLGAIDAYLLDPLQKVVDGISGRRRLKMRDFVLGDKLGEGSFGVVYFGAIVSKDFDQDEERSQRRGKAKRRLSSDERFKERVILKKVKVGVKGAEECGEYEEWFNYRLSRAAPETCAEFLGSFVADKTEVEFTKGGKWLVWKFEGDQDLGDYIRQRSFPRNLESLMFGRILEGVESLERNALIIKQVMRQLISSLKKIHDTGIVHRDVKPSNLVVTKKGRIKLIDFGAATDLRIGKNYVPDRTLFDPDYCPPELYVLPEETPSPPPEPIAALLSPILWQLNCPDLFDMYSAGIVLLQMAIPSLRSAAGLKNFNSEIKAFGYDLNEWKERTRRLPDLTILELDSGRGWDLATKLVSQRGGSLGGGRLSAAAALGHPYFLLGADQAAAVLSKFSFTK